MQKIAFGDKEYVKASAIAKQFKYTQDYVGQLCRNDKVDARLVGRVWYVNPDSVIDYRKTKHATLKKPVVNEEKTNKIKVEPVIRNKTLRVAHDALQRSGDTKQAVSKYIKASYSSDDQEVIPVVRATPEVDVEAKTLRVEPIPRVKVKIKRHTKKNLEFTADKMPEISLQAKLKINDYPANPVPQKAPVRESNALENTPNPAVKKVNKAVRPRKLTAHAAVTPWKVAVSQAKKGSAPVANPQTNKNAAGASKNVQPRSITYAVLVACVVIGSVLATIALLGVGDVIVVSGSQSEQGLSFSVERLLGVLQGLF